MNFEQTTKNEIRSFIFGKQRQKKSDGGFKGENDKESDDTTKNDMRSFFFRENDKKKRKRFIC